MRGDRHCPRCCLLRTSEVVFLLRAVVTLLVRGQLLARPGRGPLSARRSGAEGCLSDEPAASDLVTGWARLGKNEDSLVVVGEPLHE